jgi:drug/metabolite transporter (DMT)-like permease
MSEQALAIFLGLGAAICYGIADFFGAAGSKKLGPITAVCCVQTIGFIGVTLWYGVAVHTVPHVPAGIAAAAVGGAALVGLGLIFLYRAFEIGPVSLASPLGSAYPIIMVGIAVAFFHARLSARQIIGVLLVVGGVMIAAGLLSAWRSRRRLDRGPVFALLASLAWGLGYPLIDYAITHGGWWPVMLVEVVVMLLVSVAALWVNRHAEHVTKGQIAHALRNPYIIVAGLVQLAAVALLNLGLFYDPAAGSLAIALSATYPVITIILAFRHFKERLEPAALAGAGATVAGVVLLLL